MTLGLFDPAFLAVAGAVAAGGYDADAQAYITAVEAADGQALETGVRDAINAFVVGCKADGIWSAIKASCILAGARTLNGALVPLVGAAPTNFNFVSGDYNRKTGLVGNGSTKYLNSNRASNADPQNSVHGAVYRTDTANLGTAVYLGSQQSGGARNIELYTFSGATYFAARKSNTGDPFVNSSSRLGGFIACSRFSSTGHSHRIGGATATNSIGSTVPGSLNYFVFGDNSNGVLANPTLARLAFYSIGEALDLALLDARVTTLINALGAAIP